MRHLFSTLLFTIVASGTAFAANVGITWQDMSTDETGFKVDRQANGGAFTSLSACNVGANVQTCQDANVTVGTSYCYKAYAYNQVGGSAYSNTACITPAAQTPTPPANLSCVQTPTQPGLMLAMNLNATSGTTAVDSSGNSNNGMLTNGPVWAVSGKYAGALLFDGSDDYVAIPDMTTLDLSAAGTLESWVRFDVINRWNALFSKGVSDDGAHQNYWIEVSNTNIAYCGIGNGSTYQYIGTAINGAGAWQHIACTWDTTTLKIYKDGVLMTSSARTVTPMPNSGPLYLGQIGSGVDRLDGTLDDVRVWNVARTAAEIVTDRDTPVS